jgi:hypothetical protein
MNGLLGSRDERVPPEKIPSLADEPIAARWGQPFDPAHGGGIDLDAFRHPFLAIGVIRALAASNVEQTAGKAGEMDLARILILDLVQTAPATPVAKCLPFHVVEVFQVFPAPETVFDGRAMCNREPGIGFGPGGNGGRLASRYCRRR